MGKVKCPSCHGDVPGDAEACPTCGHVLPTPANVRFLDVVEDGSPYTAYKEAVALALWFGTVIGLALIL